MKRVVLLVCAGLLALAPSARGQRVDAGKLGEEIAGLGTTARVLMIGAHPDDEDTQLITWLAKARHVETAYLSLTRGDGGQNLIGNELGPALGMIRTEELLAARRLTAGISTSRARTTSGSPRRSRRRSTTGRRIRFFRTWWR